MTKEFPEGCVVKLRTGGPEMVVEDIRDDDAVCCVWFAGNEVKRDTFHPKALHWVAKGQE